MAAAAVTEETAGDTLVMLEERLQRIDYVINGDGKREQASAGQTTSTSSASARLRNLERSLKALAAKSHAVSDVLHVHTQFPELFHPGDERNIPASLAPASLAQLVLAHDNLYRTTSTQLHALHENSTVPDSAALVKLIGMQSRIAKAEDRQIEQAKEFAVLRLRSTKLLEKWYKMGVLDMGETWTDLEERLRDCEILVRRKEAAKKREEGSL